MPWSESPCRMVLGWEGGLFETFPSVAAQIRKAGQYDPSLDRIRMIGFGSPMFNLPIFCFFAAQCGSWRVQIDTHHLLFPLSTFCQQWQCRTGDCWQDFEEIVPKRYAVHGLKRTMINRSLCQVLNVQPCSVKFLFIVQRSYLKEHLNRN